MKVLIWVLCIVGFTVANELLGMLAGFKLGYLLLYLLCAGVAKVLCDKLGSPEKEGKQETPAPPQPADNWTWPPVQESEKKEKKKRTPWVIFGVSLGAAVLAVILVLVLVVMPAKAALENAIQAIDAIGTVTMESEDQILEAENLYAQLSDRAKEKVENYSALTAARKEYDRLDAAVEKAKKAIADIGEVTIESKEKIDAARRAYDALESDGLTPYVMQEYPTLTAAEVKYEQCRELHFYESGMLAYDAGRYEDAISWYEELLNAYPSGSYAEGARGGIQNSCAALSRQAMDAGDFERAKEQLLRCEETGSKTTEYTQTEKDLQQKLEALRPANGKKFADNIKWGRCTFKVTGSETCDSCVKVESTTDGNVYTTIYLRAGETVTLNLKDDVYICKYTAGADWFGEKPMFGKEAVYTKVNGTIDCTTTYSGGYVYYHNFTFTIPGSLDKMADNISAEDF